jgi:hypothetical protein
MIDERSKDQQRLILDDLDKISSIENKDSETSGHKGKPKHNIINISYTLVRLSEKGSSTNQSNPSRPASPSTPVRPQPSAIELNQLLVESH